MTTATIFSLAKALGKIKIFAVPDKELRSALIKDFYLANSFRKSAMEGIDAIRKKFAEDFAGKPQDEAFAEAQRAANEQIDEILRSEVEAPAFVLVTCDQIADLEQDDLTLEDTEGLAAILKD